MNSFSSIEGLNAYAIQTFLKNLARILADPEASRKMSVLVVEAETIQEIFDETPLNTLIKTCPEVLGLPLDPRNLENYVEYGVIHLSDAVYLAVRTHVENTLRACREKLQEKLN